MIKFYLIAGIGALTLTGLGFWFGWQHGRVAFANECIIVGNFIVYDSGLDKRRRFKCEEAPMEGESEKADEGLRI
tara:strand:- start:361 stop:585 length:225 start_codon:yes stop_codon:yes gene_type:complete